MLLVRATAFATEHGVFQMRVDRVVRQFLRPMVDLWKGEKFVNASSVMHVASYWGLPNETADTVEGCSVEALFQI